ncbi:CatA-like O-acetyltransferase [Alteromonas sp. a30]|uniref:CatA-like O-acetyltransferase n=1 Tax=Alteromonas sp. a30 TaxID=2730917 RepID=UPI00227EC92E|nr:CatA-like O-acetyltransferase [Alteromonas sp. a30]MCY7295578.1 chloramphenicol acetyltransferase [Alteromonas sp. a30]
MKTLNIEQWNRKAHFEFYNTFQDPYFAVTVELDVTQAYTFAKANDIGFFSVYLHDCLRAVNAIEPFRYRIEGEDTVVIHDVIHASTTVLRPNNTFGFSFIEYSENLPEFHQAFQAEKQRVFKSNDLFPPRNSQDCVYCSALPWLNFTGHKEAVLGEKESVPKFAFGKMREENGKRVMPVAVSVSHALMDGYHVAQFVEAFKAFLQEKKV